MKFGSTFSILAILALWAGTARAEWKPLLEPDPDRNLAYDSLFESTIEPGASVKIEPDRLRLIRVQIDDVELAGYLEFWQTFEGVEKRARLRMRPTKLAAGDYLIRVESMNESTLSIAYDADAPRAVDLSASQIRSIEPHVYWEWWQGRLLDWIRNGAQGPAPSGVDIGEMTTVYEGVREAGELVRMIEAISENPRHRKIARWLASGLTIKSIEEVRRPRFRYFSETIVTTNLANPQQPFRIDTGDFANEAVILGEGVPETLVVVGPGILRFGVRAIKEADSPDSMSRYRISVRENGSLVHDERFSSRAAKLDAEDTEDTEDTDEPVEAGSSAAFVTASNGDVVGWRRRSQFWVPPGTHRLDFEARGADVFFDAELHKPKYRVESFFSDAANLGRLLEDAESKLGEPADIATLVLRMELMALIHRFEDARSLLEAARAREGDERVQAWLDMREADWFEPDIARLDALMRDAAEDAATHPDKAWSLTRRAVELERFASAAELVSAIPVDPNESPDQVWLRASANMKGRIDRGARWEAFARSWEVHQARPLDDELRQRLLKLWWSNTFWDELPTRSGARMLQPLGIEPEIVAREQVASRRSLLYEIPRDDGFRVWAAGAPDRPERMRRIRVAAFGAAESATHELRIDGVAHPIVRRKPLEYFDFAVESARAYELGRGDALLLSTEVPDHLVDIPAHQVFEARRVPTIEENEEFVWQLPYRPTTRFIRLNFLLDGEVPSRVEVDTGIGEVRTLEFSGSAEGQTWVRAYLEIPAGAETLSLRPRGAAVRVSPELRQPKGVPDRIPINIEVNLPADEVRLARLRELSKLLALNESHELRVERAELLMSLDQDKLARADLERILAAVGVPVEMRAYVERLHAAVKIRLSSDWYELGPEWLEDRIAMPADLGAAFSKSDFDCEGPDCAVVRYLEAAGSDDANDRTKLWRFLADTIDGESWLFSSKLAREAIDLIESDPDAAPIGLAAEIYGRMRQVMHVFPSDRNRTRWYGALRWTRWESVSTLAGGSFLAQFEPPVGPRNGEFWQLPRMNDPVEKAVDRALSGTDWHEDTTYPMYGFHRRVLRFQAFDTGVLDLQMLCWDPRPDLQPTGAPEPCKLEHTLEGPSGRLKASHTGSNAPGRITSRRWPIEAGEEYKLTVERVDGLLGRTQWIRPMVHRPNKESTPLVRRVRRSTDIVPSGSPAKLTVQGPVVVRVDVRGIAPDPSPSVAVWMNGKEHKTIDIDPLEQDGAEIMSQSLTRATRELIWLDEPRAYELEFRSAPGFATVRVALRTDDYDALLRPSGQGWFDPEPVPEDLPFEPAVASKFAAQLEPADLLARDWVYGLLAGLRFASPALNLVEEVDRDTANPVMQLEAGGYLNVDDWLWLDSRLNARTRFDDSPATGIELDAYARLPWWRLRSELKTTGWLQSVGGAETSGRLEGRIGRPTSLPGEWLFLPSLSGILRGQSLDEDVEGADVVIYNQYAEDHPFTWDLELGLWFRPFVNAMAAAAIQPVFNQNATLDQVRLDISLRALLESTEVEAEYGIRFLAVDEDRFDPFLFHDLDLEAELAYWLVGGHLLTFDASTRFTLAPQTSAPFRFRFGIGFTYWFSDFGLRARPSSEVIYDDLLEPRYFLD